MKTIILLICALVIMPFAGSAQYAGQPATNLSGAGAQNVNGAAISMLSSSLNKNKSNRYISDDFIGSPYTDNNFKPALLFYEDENQGQVYYRYNAYNEEIEIKKNPLEEETINALHTDKAISIELGGGKRLSFKTFIDKSDNTLNGYLTKLYDGEIYDLFKRTKVKFTEAQPAQNSFVKATSNRFTHFTEYYLQKKGVNKIEEIILKNRKLLKMVDTAKKKELEVFIKDNNLKIKNEIDLIKAIQFLN
ncbi:hypothetical protein LB467_02090 [Salegentibacter sp. JZCK2]|uniref:hypothetical protein n=1 Tax=Salegentibacter tibetensis TaxID=2873600 RepID=UPI001CCBC608|nr:hypothetical protein [Salegentibacter tibetensis]MBZ9728464.1 hypothetical protein [Salegentibacter tibetensis]